MKKKVWLSKYEFKETENTNSFSKLNPSYVNDIFKLTNTCRLIREKYKHIKEISKFHQATFGTKSRRSYGSKIWNALLYHIKTSDQFEQFQSHYQMLGW